MAKFFLTPLLPFVVLALVAICSAVPQRRFITTTSHRNGAIRSNLRFLARQEAAAPEAAAAAPAPYPAAGVTPEVPFDLPTETEAAPVQPDQTYGPPDSTYGPPAAEEPLSQPDDTYGPPPEAAADVESPPADDAATGSNGSDAVSQNLIQPRFRSFGGRLRASPARLRAAPIQRRRGNAVEVFRSEPLIVYTLD